MTIDYKSVFQKFWDEMQSHVLFREMEDTVEASSWHREANVLVHTQMVVAEYMKIWTDVSDKKMYLGALAAMFHDVGKPEAEEVKESEERGVYRRYAGHEQVSAVEFLACMTSTPGMMARLDELQLDLEDVYITAWMIEHHLPYQMKDVAKRQGYYDTVAHFGCVDAFFSLLRADCRGRISDDHPTKLQAVEDWIAEFAKHEPTPGRPKTGKTAYVLIGTSSAGKSTLRRQFGGNLGFNMDMVRLEQYPSEGTAKEQYQHAFTQSCENKADFNNAVEKALTAAFEDEPSIVVSDNTNVSKKSRAAFIARARQKGYRVVGVLMMVHPHVALARQRKREDREGVPIWGQFRALSMPTFTTEVDAMTYHIPPEAMSD